MTRRSGPRWLRLFTAATLVASGLATGIGTAEANDTIRGLSPLVTPFSPDGDGMRDASGVRVSLAREATLDVLVLDLQGALQRRLVAARSFPAGTHAIGWDGRNDAAHRVPNAYYRLRVRASNGSASVVREAGVTVADRPIYARAPGLITVAVDPGHGGPDPGAVYDGTRESDLNLDISLRLAAMLRGAGVRVVLLRDRDTGFNLDLRDRTGDGRVDRADDLQERLDIVNAARPDLLLIVMNNASGCHCYAGPGVWRNPYRIFGAANDSLGRTLQQEFVRVLRRYETPEWRVRDTGVHDATRHHEMAGYDRATRPRPGQMPTVMGESLYLDQPAELALLRRPGVRQAIASAYYEAVARWVATRPTAVGYRLVRGPGDLAARSPAWLEVEVINRGQTDLTGARVRLAVRPDDAWHDGHNLPGTVLASAPLQTLPPTGRQTLRLPFTAPAAGAWRLQVDVVRPDGARLASLGSPVLALPVRVGAAASPPPSTSPSASASPAPSASGSPSPSPSPSASPSSAP
jgi:N-acetylmuramoyl-L-alanine amidase